MSEEDVWEAAGRLQEFVGASIDFDNAPGPFVRDCWTLASNYFTAHSELGNEIGVCSDFTAYRLFRFGLAVLDADAAHMRDIYLEMKAQIDTMSARIAELEAAIADEK